MTKVSNADRRLPMEERAHVVDDGRLAIPGFRRGSVGYGCNRPPSAVPTLRSDLATGAGDDVPPLPSPPLFPTSPAMNAPNPPLRAAVVPVTAFRSEEHTSELQSLMRLSYAVFCWQK